MEDDGKDLAIKLFGYFCRYGVFAMLGISGLCAAIAGFIHGDMGNILAAVVMFGILGITLVISIAAGIFKDW